MVEVFFHCPRCSRDGTFAASRREWASRLVEYPCPQCGMLLSQKRLHFELYDHALQHERITIVYKRGSLSHADRFRLREIHEALGSPPATELTDTQVDIVLDRTSHVMEMIQHERA